MKKFFLFSIISLLSVTAFSFSHAKDLAFNRRALQLLANPASNIKLSGDVLKGETLAEILASIKLSKSHSMNCTIQNSDIASCTMFIEFAPMGETGIIFQVRLDETQMPKSILGSSVEISRGD